MKVCTILIILVRCVLQKKKTFGPTFNFFLFTENFRKHEIGFAEFCANPDILTSPDLVVRMGGR